MYSAWNCLSRKAGISCSIFQTMLVIEAEDDVFSKELCMTSLINLNRSLLSYVLFYLLLISMELSHGLESCAVYKHTSLKYKSLKHLALIACKCHIRFQDSWHLPLILACLQYQVHRICLFR